MNNFDRNTRTLIVSFLIAIFTMIPLRFIEVGNEQNMYNDPQVLGESVVIPAVETEKNTEDQIKIEAPYNEIESCVGEEEVNEIEDKVVSLIKEGDLSKEQILLSLEELEKVKTNICK